MAKGKKTGGRDFVKGVCPNPNGRPRTPEDIAQARAIAKDDFARAMDKYMRMPVEYLRELLGKSDLPAFENAAISVLVAASMGADHQRFGFLLDRWIGKVKDEVEHSVSEETLAKLLDGTHK